jgi:PKD repeat protein
VYRSVRIELRSAEPRLFPQNPGNALPNCAFIVEPAVGPYKVNTSILFQTTSSDNDGTIVRYAWNFGDGTTSDQPDEEHHYGVANTYTVEHGVTDDDGGQRTCTQTVVVVN